MTYPEEHMRTWNDPDGFGFTLRLYDLKQTQGTHWQVRYELAFKGRIMFNERTGVPSLAGHAIDSDYTVGGALRWCGLKPGDTDFKAFAGYTQDQLDFVAEWGETLRMYADELEE